MKILYIHQYFKTPQEGGAIRSYHIAKDWIKNGHEVTMLTSKEGSKIENVNIEGINVIYLPVNHKNKHNFIRRIFAYFYFIYLAKKTIKNTSFDFAYITSTPLTVVYLAKYIHSLNKSFYFEVRDLWPEAPIQMGYLPVLKKYFYKLEKWAYDHALGIISLSKDMTSYIELKTNTPICTVTNFAETEFYSNSNPINEIFTIGYFGTFGKANGIDFIKNAIMSTKNSKIKWILCGEGALLNQLKSETSDCHHIQFYHQLNKDKIKELITSCDATLCSFSPFKVLESNSPNKFFDGLAAGKLSIINTDGWMNEALTQCKAGIYIPYHSSENFLQHIEPFLQDVNLLKLYQNNAFMLAKAYDKDKQLKHLHDFIFSSIRQK